MEEDARDNGGLRPFSTQTMPSRFPSLRRLTSAEPYRHRSLPADAPSPGSDRPSSEITFAVLYDDGPDYHLGHFDDAGSIRSGRPTSSQSYAPSFRTRDSRITSEDHEHHNQDFVVNQRLLAEGYLNANDSQQQFDRYHGNSQETLSMNNLRHLDLEKGQNPFETPTTETGPDAWCDCEDEHDHGGLRDVKDPSKFGNIANIDLDTQHGQPPASPTPLREKEDPDAYVVCAMLLSQLTDCR